ncbi:hypothetical protein M8494_28660 [Serratia ureilytica]
MTTPSPCCWPGAIQIDLLAVTTVVGNQTLDKVTRNALAVARIANITGVPFAAGCRAAGAISKWRPISTAIPASMARCCRNLTCSWTRARGGSDHRYGDGPTRPAA